MQFTIVIPVLNGEKHIERCIDNINNMVLSNIELNIIVVDNGSTDATISILEKNNINYIICLEANISHLRNTGASMSVGQFVGFVDSDCLVDKYWMIEAINILNANDTVGVVGRYYDVCDKPSWVELAWYERRKNLDGPVKFLPAGNMVVRKSLFDNLGGFSTGVITGEDYEFCQRVREAGYLIYNSSKVNVKHLGNVKKLRDVIRKERWYGLGMFSTLKNECISMPLIACTLFIISSVSLVFTILLIQSYFIVILLFMVLIVFFVSVHFTKNIIDNKLIMILKFMPISFCYLMGRSLGIFDLIIKQLRKVIKHERSKCL